jgi:uncharacterized membrane protein YphA (DoxX/SURF4 family)
MKKINIAYWICTLSFAALMLFSAIGDAMLSAEAVKFMTSLGYPNYFTQFIGIAKILGVIGILLPISPRLKEWAYAGLFFDLIGATYSVIAVFGFNITNLFMGIWIGSGILSYILWHKKLKAAEAKLALS